MKLTRERKAYLAILGLGAAGFLVDRLFLSPAEAGAAGPAAQDCAVSKDDTPAAAPTPGAAPASPDKADPRFSDLINAAPAPPRTGARDLFRPPESWPTATVQAQLDGPPLPDFDEFLQSHRLNGVVQPLDGKPGMAWVAGKVYRPGDNIDGFTLASVSETAVEFRSPSGDVRKVELIIAGSRAGEHQPQAGPAPAR